MNAAANLLVTHDETFAVFFSMAVNDFDDPGASPVWLKSVGRDEMGSLVYHWDAPADVPGYVFLCYAVFYPDSEFVQMIFGFVPASAHPRSRANPAIRYQPLVEVRLDARQGFAAPG